MRASRFSWILMVYLPLTSNFAAAFDLPTPDFLSAPTVARAATGNTYLYLGSEGFPDAELRVSVVEIPRELLPNGTTPCVEAFIAELRRAHPSLFIKRELTPLNLGPVTAGQWRWSSSSKNQPLLTGVVSCGIYRDRYVAAVFQDTALNASKSFPAIRAALKDITLR
jgi:hypothetical protein